MRLQMPAREALVRAVDEDRLLAHQGLGARVGERIEEQGASLAAVCASEAVERSKSS